MPFSYFCLEIMDELLRVLLKVFPFIDKLKWACSSFAWLVEIIERDSSCLLEGLPLSLSSLSVKGFVTAGSLFLEKFASFSSLLEILFINRLGFVFFFFLVSGVLVWSLSLHSPIVSSSAPGKYFYVK